MKSVRTIGISIGILFLFGRALATTPAGTLIKNQASASYTMDGTEYYSTSNEVITEVLPVYGLDIFLNGADTSTLANPARIQSAFPGNEVYFMYKLESYANTGDTVNFELDIPTAANDFTPTNLRVYLDENHNGVPDVGELQIAEDTDGDGVWDIISQDLDSDGKPDLYLPEDDHIHFILELTIPSSGISEGDSVYVGIRGTSGGDATVFDPQTGEAGVNYSLTVVTFDASIWAYKTATPTVVAPLDTITYTIAGSNIGGQTSFSDTIIVDGGTDTLTGVILKDPLDTNITYVSASITGIPSGTVIYWNGLDWVTTEPASFDSIGYVFPDIDPNQTFNLTFEVTVNSGLEPETHIDNIAVLTWRDNTPSKARQTFLTNHATVTVSAPGAYIYSLLLGPYGNPGAAPGGNSNQDTSAVDTISAGSFTRDTLSVTNTGNSSSYINIVDSTLGMHGLFVQFLGLDGYTPLSDDNSDGYVDVGYVAPGDTVSFIVKISVPSDTPTTGIDKEVIIKAFSAEESDSFNLTRIVIDSIIGVGVLFGNTDGGGNGTVDETPDTAATDPVQSVDFALDIINKGGSDDNFTLSTPSLPDNFTVTFYHDADSDGVLDPQELTPINSVGPLAPGEEDHIIARITVPLETSADTYDVVLRATSTNNTGIYDEQSEAIIVNLYCRVDISPDRQGTARQGGIIIYEHLIVNKGNTGSPSSPDTFNLTATSPQGWTYIFLDDSLNILTDRDGDGNPDVTLAPSDSTQINVKVFVPANAPPGAIDNATITATSSIGGCSDFVTDITAVTEGVLDLSITVDKQQAYPDSDLTYTINYKNLGTDSTDQTTIYDPIPTNTEYKVGSASAGTTPSGVTVVIEFSNDGGATWTYTPVGVYDPAVTNVRFRLTGRKLGPAEEGDVNLTVRIK